MSKPLAEPYYLLAFDPGVTTGWGLIKVHNGEVEVISHGQFTDIFMVANVIDHTTILAGSAGAKLVVIYEKFSVRNSAVNTFALEIIGAIKLFLSKYHADVDLRGQLPDQRKVVDHRRPEWIRPYRKHPHSQSHYGDALSHAMTYAILYLGARVLKHLDGTT